MDDGVGAVGLALVGAGGAIGTTVAAAVELLRRGTVDTTGLPLAHLSHELCGLPAYDDIVVGGWDVREEPISELVREHGVLSKLHAAVIEQVLRDQRAWPGVVSDRFTPSLAATTHRKRASSHRDAVSLIRDDLEAFSERSNASQIILVNVASTERGSDLEIPTRDELEAAIDASDPRLSPTLLYAYAAITAGVAVANFTPSSCVEQPGMLETAVSCSVPVAGRDGKTGQTFLKTALAPALRSRNLRVNGWYSANLLGNGDGRALRDPEALARKLLTKRSVLDSLMGYPVENHIVTIDFYPPRGDDKEAWDVIDFTGFLGRTMQLRLNLQCSDSLLAAPLVIELARLLALAHHRNRVGSVSELGYFFKDPMPTATGIVEHDLFRQQATLLEWLKG